MTASQAHTCSLARERTRAPSCAHAHNPLEGLYKDECLRHSPILVLDVEGTQSPSPLVIKPFGLRPHSQFPNGTPKGLRADAVSKKQLRRSRCVDIMLNLLNVFFFFLKNRTFAPKIQAIMKTSWKIIIHLVIKIIDIIINTDRSQGKHQNNESIEQGNSNSH